MTLLPTRLMASLIALSMLGCPSANEPAATPSSKGEKTSKKAKKGPRLEGEIHVGQKRRRVLPFILHQPSLDLRVQCLTRRDELLEKGESAPLCFSEAPRNADTVLTTLRLEHREGMHISESLKRLSSLDEAAHFAIDNSGTPYQLLDLAFPARRGEVYPVNELRVLSGNDERAETLVATLTELFPKLKVERVALKPLPASAEPSHKKGAGSHKAESGTHKAESGSHKAESGSHKAESGSHKAESPAHKAESPDHKD